MAVNNIYTEADPVPAVNTRSLQNVPRPRCWRWKPTSQGPSLKLSLAAAMMLNSWSVEGTAGTQRRMGVLPGCSVFSAYCLGVRQGGRERWGHPLRPAQGQFSIAFPRCINAWLLSGRGDLARLSWPPARSPGPQSSPVELQSEAGMSLP